MKRYILFGLALAILMGTGLAQNVEAGNAEAFRPTSEQKGPTVQDGLDWLIEKFGINNINTRIDTDTMDVWLALGADENGSTIEVRIRNKSHVGPEDLDSSQMTSFPITEHSEIQFPDPNLEAVIRDAINIPEGSIYAMDLEGLKELDAREKSIKDITGLEHCSNLEDLDLRSNQNRH
jgi:Leucine-rich repeat (LRR) protein